MTLPDDAELKIYLPVGFWRIELFLGVDGTLAGDIKVDWVWTGTNAGVSARMVLGPQVPSTDNTAAGMRSTGPHTLSSAVGYGQDPAVPTLIREDLILDVTGEGTLTMRWAQNTSNATATSVLAGSRLYATRMTGGWDT